MIFVIVLETGHSNLILQQFSFNVPSHVPALITERNRKDIVFLLQTLHSKRHFVLEMIFKNQNVGVTTNE